MALQMHANPDTHLTGIAPSPQEGPIPAVEPPHPMSFAGSLRICPKAIARSWQHVYKHLADCTAAFGAMHPHSSSLVCNPAVHPSSSTSAAGTLT
eukprot:1159167-Pelagomonas_calceolata.AAC.2